MAKVLLAGLDQETTSAISLKLTQIGYQTESQDFDFRRIESSDADLILASGDDIRGLRLIGHLRNLSNPVPLVIVSRVADDEKWISALEAGATDYCAVAIDAANLRWIVDNACGRRTLASVAA